MPFAVLAGEIAPAASSDHKISRSQISGATKRDPYLARGTYTLRLRGHDLVASWHGTARRNDADRLPDQPYH